MKLKVKKLNEDAMLPTRAHPWDAGADLYAAEAVPYKADDVVIFVPTHVSIGIEPGYVGLICDRSSMARSGFKVGGGVVDAGYTGEVGVMLLNLTKQHGCIAKGAKIAQMLLIPVMTPLVEEVTELAESERGSGAYGSTGK